MDDPNDATPSRPFVFQQLQTEDGEPLQSVQTHALDRFGQTFVYWSDIQDAFPDVNYLLDDRGDRVFFEVVNSGDKYDLASPLRIKASHCPFTVVTYPMDKPILLHLKDLLQWRDRIYSTKPEIANSPEFIVYLAYSLLTMKERLFSAPRPEPTIPEPHTLEEANAGATNEVEKPHGLLQSAAPRLFLILPSDLKRWDDSDPSTHSFRLYFMCDCEYESSTEGSNPTNVHIANHPGYDLDEPLEFIRRFGHFSLSVLEAVRSGYASDRCCFPKLDTHQILHCPGDDTTHHRLTRASMGPHVDKAIAYIHERLLLEAQLSERIYYYIRSTANAVVFWFLWISSVAAAWFQWKPYQDPQSTTQLDRSKLRSFLRLHDGDTGVGGLNCVKSYYTTRWLCQSHAFASSNTDALEKHVRSVGGSIDLQLATINIGLGSMHDVFLLVSTLHASRHIFDLSLSFTWNLSREDLWQILRAVTECHVSTLQINGGMHSILESAREYSSDLFARYIGVDAKVFGHLITLPRYPRSTESYIYFGEHSMVLGLLFEGTVDRLNVDWAELGRQLDPLDRRLHDAMRTENQKELHAMWAELTRVMKPLLDQGLKAVDIFDRLSKTLECRLEVTGAAIAGITELRLPFSISHTYPKELPILQRLFFRPDAVVHLDLLYEVMVKSPKLLAIDIPIQEQDVFKMIFYLFRTWPVARILLVTLYEYDSGDGGAPLAMMIIGRQAGTEGPPGFLKILQWGHNHVSKVMDDWVVDMLDHGTQSSPVSLKSLMLDTSSLTKVGLECLQRVLKQCELEFLSIECGAFDPAVASELGRVLEAVNWSALKSLELVGSKIGDWINLWVKYSNITKLVPLEVQLIRLSVVGSGGEEQRLSHRGALWLHDVIYWFSPAEIQLKNIGMQEETDWELIRGASENPVSEEIALTRRQLPRNIKKNYQTLD